MIVSAFNDAELEALLLNSLEKEGIKYQKSEDRHLGRSWEIQGDLPHVPGYAWNGKLAFGVYRQLLEADAISEAAMLEIVKNLEFQKSSLGGVVADFPIPFNEVCNLPFIKRVKRGWTTLKAIWNAPDGQVYIFRLGLSGTQGYSYISKSLHRPRKTGETK